MPTTWLRVVCGLGVTMVTFCSINVLRSVDLPALGGPMMATQPHLCGVVLIYKLLYSYNCFVLCSARSARKDALMPLACSLRHGDFLRIEALYMRLVGCKRPFLDGLPCAAHKGKEIGQVVQGIESEA